MTPNNEGDAFPMPVFELDRAGLKGLNLVSIDCGLVVPEEVDGFSPCAIVAFPWEPSTASGVVVELGMS
jgi:hypothetical protein